MKEAYLHHVWKSKRLQVLKTLETTDKKRIEISYPGDYNQDQGPDFNYAKIYIDGILWIGQIEMHIFSSDWNNHKHSIDPRYHNVILHVVWIYDEDITINNSIIPTLELSKFLSENEFEKYEYLINNKYEFPCVNQFPNIPENIKISQFDAAFFKRMEVKMESCKKELLKFNNNWEELYYRYLCRYMVNPPNAEAMEGILNKLPWNLVSKLQEDPIQLEALFFGVGGFLESNCNDEYFQLLKEKFEFLQNKFHLKIINLQNWYFLRLRPAHFPTLRIAQLSNYFSSQKRPFLDIIQMNNLTEVFDALKMSPSSYWHTHYQFNVKSTYKLHNLGDSSKNVLIINVIIPLLYSYGLLHFKQDISNKALNWYEELKPENNVYTRRWNKLQFQVKNALQSQASIHQFKEYCLNKKCLDCKIGYHILYHTSPESFIFV